LRPQQPRQQAQGPKTSTCPRPGATTVFDSKRGTALAKPPAKKGKFTAPKNRKSRQIARSSKSETVSRPRRKATAASTKQPEQNFTSQSQPPRKGAKRGKAKQSGPAAGKAATKTSKGKAKSKSSDPAPAYSQELVPSEESGRRDHREASEAQYHHQALSREALEQLSLQLGSIVPARDEEDSCR